MIPPAYGPFAIQDADDYAGGLLTPSDVGKFMAVVDRNGQLSFALVDAPETTILANGMQQVRAIASRIQDAPDGPGKPATGDNGKALAWNQVDGRFELITVNASDADTLDGHDSSYFLAASAEPTFLLANGTRAGATSQAQTFTNGIVGPSWKPASNSTTALQVQNAAGTSIVNVDTTNNRIGFNTTSPSYLFDTVLPDTSPTTPGVHTANTGGVELITNTVDRDFSGAGHWTGTNWSVSGGVLTHTPGSTADAVLANANLTAGSILSGRRYYLTFTISGMTAGAVSPKIGSVTADGGAISANGTYTQTVAVTADNANIIFTPNSAFDGSIDNVSVTRVQNDFTILNSGFVGVGTASPNRFMEIKAPASNLFTALALYNPLTFVNNGSVVSFRTDTTGSGATAFVECAAFRAQITDHNNATLATEFHITHRINGAATQALTINSSGFWGINAVTAPTARLHIAGNATLAAWGLNGSGLRFAGATYTDSSTAGSGTATNAVAYALGRPTFAASNASVTMTNAATLYIENSPAAGANATLTNKYALWVDDGDVRLDGHLLTGDATANTNTPSGATAYKFPIYNQTGTLLGYIPVYASAW